MHLSSFVNSGNETRKLFHPGREGSFRASAADLREEKQNSCLSRVVIEVQLAAKHTEKKQD